MSVRTQNAGQELEKLILATRNRDYFRTWKCGGKAMRRCVEGEERILDGEFAFLREVVVEVGDVATDEKFEVHECEMDGWEGRGGMSEQEVSKREADKRKERNLCVYGG